MATMLVKVNDTNQSCLYIYFEILFQGDSIQIKNSKNVFCPANIPVTHVGPDSNTLFSPVATLRKFSRHWKEGQVSATTTKTKYHKFPAYML